MYLDALEDDDPVCLARLRGGFIFGQIARARPETCETAALMVQRTEWQRADADGLFPVSRQGPASLTLLLAFPASPVGQQVRRAVGTDWLQLRYGTTGRAMALVVRRARPCVPEPLRSF